MGAVVALYQELNRNRVGSGVCAGRGVRALYSHYL